MRKGVSARKAVNFFSHTQAEVKWDNLDFKEACKELIVKLATWSATLHGSRDYMLCYAAGGFRLRFYAVRNDGTHAKVDIRGV